jgi:hypothetical protein
MQEVDDDDDDDLRKLGTFNFRVSVIRILELEMVAFFPIELGKQQFSLSFVSFLLDMRNWRQLSSVVSVEELFRLVMFWLNVWRIRARVPNCGFGWRWKYDLVVFS